MSDQAEFPGPEVITPLESSYIRAALPAILPAVNFLIDATNLDVALHITKLTTDQLWKGFNALLVTYSVGAMIYRRIRDGNDPNSTARKIVLRKPPDPPPNDFQQIVDDLAAPHEPEILKVESDPESPRLAERKKPVSHGMSDEDLVDLIRKSGQKRPTGEGQAPVP